MSETMKDSIKRDFDQKSFSMKKKTAGRSAEVDKLKSDIDAFLAKGGTVELVDGLYSNWDNVDSKTRYNSHEMYKPAGVGDGQG